MCKDILRDLLDYKRFLLSKLRVGLDFNMMNHPLAFFWVFFTGSSVLKT